MFVWSELEKMRSLISVSEKTRICSLSTTANENNCALSLSPIRETATTIAININFCDLSNLEKVITMFDGFVEYFLLDCEVKYSEINLEEASRALISSSKIVVFKPNDLTVEAIDLWVSNHFCSLLGLNVCILGVGNIGSKLALKFAERGAKVTLVGRNEEKDAVITNALNYMKRGSGSIDLSDCLEKEVVDCFDLALLCTPGVPVFDDIMVRAMKVGSMILDVGNGCVSASSFEGVKKKNLELRCASVTPAYHGYIESLFFTIDMVSKPRIKKISSTQRLVIPGVYGYLGDILVDDVDHVEKIIGVCDGKGSVLAEPEKTRYIKKYLEDSSA